MKKSKLTRRQRIKRSIRSRISGTAEKPRMSVFRSNKQIYVQIIDDLSGKTIVSSSSRDKSFADHTGNKIEQAQKVGKLLAERAKEAGVEQVIFDRNGYLYHGRVKSLADGARSEGLKF